MLYESESGDLTLALTGDSMLTRRLAVFKEPRFLELRDLLRRADVTFTNFESSAHEYGEGFPTFSAGSFMTCEPKLIEELKWLGINLVSTANNHVFDWGEQGVMLNISNLNQAGLIHAGTGSNLREATRPAYLDTAKGRVALISASSPMAEWSRATNQRVDAPGKPGMNVLGFHKRYVVDRRAFEELRRIGDRLAFDAERRRIAAFGFWAPSEIAAASEEQYKFLGSIFTFGEDFAVNTTVNEQDAAENLRQVREARRQADWVLFSLHNHEQGGKSIFTASKPTEIEEQAEFVIDFAHRCIDEGVDVFIGHGPHFPLGIEIYKGKPIFYSLGNFIYEFETLNVLPSYSYDRFGLDPFSTPADFNDVRSDGNRKAHVADRLFWESVAVQVEFNGRELKEINIYPLDLGFGRPRPQRGRPVLADEEVRSRIIARLARLSADMGTRIEYVDGRGVVEGL